MFDHHVRSIVLAFVYHCATSLRPKSTQRCATLCLLFVLVCAHTHTTLYVCACVSARVCVCWLQRHAGAFFRSLNESTRRSCCCFCCRRCCCSAGDLLVARLIMRRFVVVVAFSVDCFGFSICCCYQLFYCMLLLLLLLPQYIRAT